MRAGRMSLKKQQELRDKIAQAGGYKDHNDAVAKIRQAKNEVTLEALRKGGLLLTFAECRKLYEDAFQEELPMAMPYIEAAKAARSLLGDEVFVVKLNEMRGENR